MPDQVSPGTVVSPRGYLAVAGASIQAMTRFTTALEIVPEEPTAPQLRSVVPALDLALAEVRTADRRLAAVRVSDRRIESQRAAASQAFDASLAALEGVRTAAAAGDLAAFRSATDVAERAIGTLRGIGGE